MTALIANRNYRMLFSASAVSNLADGIALVALPWLATLLTRDATLIALTTVAGRLPWVLFSIPAGAIVDRGDRRRLMLRADLFRMAVTLGLVGLVMSPGGSAEGRIAVLAAIAFLIGGAEVICDNAAQTLMPAIVAPDQLERANGRLWSAEMVASSFIGPPLAGLLIAMALPAPFLANAACFALAALLVWCIAAPPRVLPLRRRFAAEIVEGWRWMAAHRPVLRFALMVGCLNLLNTMVMTVLPLVAQERLALGAVGYGLLLTAMAVGGVLGGLFGPAVAARLGPRRSVLLALAATPLPVAALALAEGPALAAAALALFSAAGVLWNVVTVSWRQRLIPDALLGRVNALYRFFAFGMMPLGALLGGGMVSLAEPFAGRDTALQLPILAAAAGAALVWLWGWRTVRL